MPHVDQDTVATLRELAVLESLMRARGIKVPKLPPLPKPKSSVDDHLSALEWAAKYRRIEGQPFTLEEHKPLKALYEDQHPHIVVIKPAQVGVSEMAVTKTLHALDVGAQFWQTGKSGLNVAYLFPTGKALSDFSKERFSGILGEHPHIAALFEGGFDDITFKQAGHSYLYLRSTWLGRKGNNKAGESLLSFPADVLVLDEFDRMNRGAVEMARKRMRASSVQRELDISTPTIPGRGIHELYLQSDQRVWEVPCSHCDHWQEMDFFRDVHGNGADYETWKTWEREQLLRATWEVWCEHCHRPIDRLADGRWTARNPEALSLRGYHVPALAFAIVDLAQLAVNATSDDPSAIEEFYRSDLGLPFEPAGSTITDMMLDDMAASEPLGGPYTHVTMGVDVGSRFHYRISGVAKDGAREVIDVGAVRDWADLDKLIERYRVRRVVIDALPELHACKEWADKHKHKVFRAFYPQDKTMAGELYKVKEQDRIVQINRTQAMDSVYSRIAGTRERWPRQVAENREVRDHLKSPSRVTTVDAAGNPWPTWVHVAPDHTFHAFVYDLIAAQIKPKERPGALAQAKVKGWGARR